MKLKDRLPILIKYSQMHIFLLISFVYGILFGSAFSIGEFITGESSLPQLLLTAFATGGVYFCIFSIAMVGIYMGQSTKAFISLSMQRKMIIKLWKELNILIALIDTVIVMVILISSRFIDDDVVRLLDMDLDHMGPREILVMFVVLMLIFFAILQLVSIIANIGNNYGPINLVTSIILGLSISVTLVIPILNLIVWGQYLYLSIAGFILINQLMVHINKKMLNRVEVLR